MKNNMNKKFIIIFCMVLLFVSLISGKNLNITGGGNSLFFVNGASGYVGIGTDNPSDEFNVIGSGNFTGNITASYYCIGNNCYNTFGNSSWNESLADTLYLSNSGDTATGNYNFDTNTLYIDSSNNRIGIGTDSPTSTLKVIGDGSVSSFSLNEGDKSYFTGFYQNNFFQSIIRQTNTANAGQAVLSGEMRYYLDRTYSNTHLYGINALYFSAVRMNDDEESDGEGTLTNLAGINLKYGHFSSDMGNAVTTNTYGIKLTPELDDGTMTNVYDLFIGDPDSTGATITNHYGIYQEYSSAKNYFAGDVGIGTDNPSDEFNVIGSGNFTGNITADYYFGDGSQLSGISGSGISNDLNWVNISQVEYSIGNWSGDKESYSTTAEILAFGYYNETDFVITDYFTKAEIGEFGYYNLSDFDIADYFTSAEVLAFDYYNSSDFDINDYVTSVTLAGYNYYNSSDFSISDYYNKTQVGEFGYYNLSDFDINDYATNIKVDSLGNWSDDKSDYYNKTEIENNFSNLDLSGDGTGGWTNFSSHTNTSLDVHIPEKIYLTNPYFEEGSSDTEGHNYADNSTDQGATWSNVNNVLADDGSYASATTQTSKLRVTDFDFSIPTDATINEIEVKIEGNNGGGCNFGFPVITNEIYLVYSGSQQGDDNGGAGSGWGSSGDDTETWAGYGTWSSGLSASQINDDSFGIEFDGVCAAGGSATLNIDYVSIKISYTEASTNINNNFSLEKTSSDKFVIKYNENTNIIDLDKNSSISQEISNFSMLESDFIFDFSGSNEIISIGKNVTSNSGQIKIGSNIPDSSSSISIGVDAGALGNGVAIGEEAGKGATLGTNSVAIGRFALEGGSGDENVAIGTSALRDNLGRRNTAIGTNAISGSDTVNSEFSTGVGWSALYSNEGNGSTGIGYSAGYDNEGKNLFALGRLAGKENKGDNVTLIGYEAGIQNEGNNKIAIGYRAGYRSNSSNQIYLGFEAGKLNNDSGIFILKQNHINEIPLIWGNFSSGFIGLNTTQPTAPLEVNLKDYDNNLSIKTAGGILADAYYEFSEVYDEEYLNPDGSVNHSLHPCYAGEIEVNNYSAPIYEEVTYQECEDCYNETDGSPYDCNCTNITENVLRGYEKMMQPILKTSCRIAMMEEIAKPTILENNETALSVKNIIAENYLTNTPADLRSEEEKEEELEEILEKKNETGLRDEEGKLKAVPEIAEAKTDKSKWSLSGMVDWVYETTLKQEEKIKMLENRIAELEKIINSSDMKIIQNNSEDNQTETPEINRTEIPDDLNEEEFIHEDNESEKSDSEIREEINQTLNETEIFEGNESEKGNETEEIVSENEEINESEISEDDEEIEEETENNIDESGDESDEEPEEVQEEQEESEGEEESEEKEEVPSITGNIISAFFNRMTSVFSGFITGNVVEDAEKEKLEKEVEQLKMIVCEDHPEKEICKGN